MQEVIGPCQMSSLLPGDIIMTDRLQNGGGCRFLPGGLVIPDLANAAAT